MRIMPETVEKYREYYYDTVKKLVRRGLDKKGQIEVWEQYKADYPDEEPKK